LVSNQVMEEEFVCDLVSCKGGCCVDGDAGAPLEKQELEELNKTFQTIKPYLTRESISVIENQGKYIYDAHFGWVTPTLASGMCAYGIKDARGIVKCGLERAHRDGKTSWEKPLSCHLFPIKIKKSRNGKTDFVNYEPREDLCQAACSLGKKQKVPVFVFLRDALIRKYGSDFYEALSATAAHYAKLPPNQ